MIGRLALIVLLVWRAAPAWSADLPADGVQLASLGESFAPASPKVRYVLSGALLELPAAWLVTPDAKPTFSADLLYEATPLAAPLNIPVTWTARASAHHPNLLEGTFGLQLPSVEARTPLLLRIRSRERADSPWRGAALQRIVVCPKDAETTRLPAIVRQLTEKQGLTIGLFGASEALASYLQAAGIATFDCGLTLPAKWPEKTILIGSVAAPLDQRDPLPEPPPHCALLMLIPDPDDFSPIIERTSPSCTLIYTSLPLWDSLAHDPRVQQWFNQRLQNLTPSP